MDYNEDMILKIVSLRRRVKTEITKNISYLKWMFKILTVIVLFFVVLLLSVRFELSPEF